MIPRAALRSIQPSRVHVSSIQHGPASAFAALKYRHYASFSSKPPRPPQAPSAAKAGRAAPPPPKAFAASSSSKRQPSPSASAPKDATIKPQGGAAGAATPVLGARPTDATANAGSPLNASKAAQEPIAQQLDADQPPPGSAREQAQEGVAESENTAPPQETAAGQATPTGPLPDLRQGLPSTFDIEFGTGAQRKTKSTAATSAAEDDKFDITSPAPEGTREREREEREYDRSAYETSIDRKRQQVANYLFVTIFLAAGLGAFYLARPFSVRDELPKGFDVEDASGWAPGKMYARVRARFGNQLGYYTEPIDTKLLPDVPESQRAPYTLVLSLEDLLIHTSWDTKHGYRVAKRPGVDYFIRYLSQYYELVLFTSVPKVVADPVISKLDPYHFLWPLGREATKFENGEIIKDLSYLNRPLPKTLMIDTKEEHARNQPENAIVLPKWNGDPKDPHAKDLVALIPFLEYVATMGTEDVRTVLKSFEGKAIPDEFARREAEARKRFNEQLTAERSRKPRYSLGSVASSLGVKGGPGQGMVLADGQSVAAGLAQGKMLSDQIREQGQRQYEALEKQIRENGAQWLKDEAEENKKLQENHMKEMKQNTFSWFNMGGSKTG